MLGSLDAVAPFITLWFLTCYAIINLACAYLGYERIPSFRPTYRYYHWTLSLLGVAVCGFMMFYIAPLSALGALAIAAGLYKRGAASMGGFFKTKSLRGRSSPSRERDLLARGATAPP